MVDARLRLRQVALDLRSRFPQLAPSGVLQSEQVNNPDEGDKDTVAVDSFLFDEEDEEAMAEDGKLPRAKCNKCGATDTKMLGKEKASFYHHRS